MKTLTGLEAQAEMEAWWRRQQRGHKVTKVLAANDYPGLFADSESCQAWCDGRLDESTEMLFREPNYSRIRRDYADLAAARIRAGVQVTRVVLMDMEALRAGRPGWRDWVIEQFYPRLLVPLTDETVYYLPILMVHEAIRKMTMDINAFEGAGVMYTAYSQTGVAYREFYDCEDRADETRVLIGNALVSSIRGVCREQFRIQAIR